MQRQTTVLRALHGFAGMTNPEGARQKAPTA